MLADLTFAKTNHGVVYSHVSDWEGARPLAKGDGVTVIDGEDVPMEARVLDIDPDGTVILKLTGIN